MIDESESTAAVCILPAQYWNRRTLKEPWHRLMLAVLVDAIQGYKHNFASTSARDRRDFHEAREWLFSRGEGAPFSCETICHTLDIDPAYLRDELRRWRAARVSTNSLGVAEKHHALFERRRAKVKSVRRFGSRARIHTS
jgi:hypothetical protein